MLVALPPDPTPLDRHAPATLVPCAACLQRRSPTQRTRDLATAALPNRPMVVPPVLPLRDDPAAEQCAQDRRAGVLAQLFRDNWATVQGLTPVTKELVEEAGEVGAKLLQLLKPGAGKGAASQLELERLRDQRNRLWTLLVAGHSELSAAGYWQWREGYRAHVPALQARVG